MATERVDECSGERAGCEEEECCTARGVRDVDVVVDGCLS